MLQVVILELENSFGNVALHSYGRIYAFKNKLSFSNDLFSVLNRFGFGHSLCESLCLSSKISSRAIHPFSGFKERKQNFVYFLHPFFCCIQYSVLYEMILKDALI